MRQLPDFSRGESHADSCANLSQQRTETLRTMNEPGSKACLLARAADHIVSAWKSALVEPDKRVVFELYQRDTLSKRQQVVGRQHGFKRDFLELNNLKLLRQFRAGAAWKGKINVTGPQRLHLVSGSHLAEHEFHFGLSLAERSQGRSQSDEHWRYIT